VLAALIAAAVAPALDAQATVQPVPVTPAPAPCLAVVQPIPSGVTDRPLDDWATQPDHYFLHSSTNLQGYPTTEKFAAGLFYFPSTPAELADFQSVIVVTNPTPAPGAAATIAIDYFDEAGNPLATTTATIPAEGTHTEVASPLALGSVPGPGRGSARIRSTNGVKIVGVTDHWALQVDLTAFSGGALLTDPDPFNPGLSSMQQLQARQATKTQLSLGPLPRSTTARIDFLNRNAPFFWVMNPNPTPTTVTISISSDNGVVLPTIGFTLPAFATHLDLTLWNLFLAGYLGGAAVNDDFRVVVNGTQAILGDVVMADFFRGSALGERFRIGSAMMANTASPSLVNPDFTFETTPPGIQTIVGLFNPTATDIGPVRVRYFDRDGAAVGPGDNFPTFPGGALRRIGPGLASSPNYPTTDVFAGWMRITACKGGLVGWTMRTAGDVPGVTNPGFNKVWGEELTGANGLEPGDGFAVTVAGQSRIRKVAPLVRADGSWYWPGYTTFVNDGASNVGNYEFRYFATDTSGFPANATPIPPGGAFAGVRFGATSFTYEDPLVSPTFGAINLSERVDTASGGHDGINVIGDPLIEWGIFDAFPEE
jgi:hypothetical protein